jgi:hypothetical protein
MYYTFSTTAQALAGALAVLVAVVLFKFSSVTDAIHAGTETRWYGTASKVRPQFGHLIALSLADIGFCLVALPLTPLIAPYAVCAAAAMIVSVGLGIACLVLYWRLIMTVTQF